MSSVNEIVLASPADFHVHVRQGAMCELVTPHVALGGIHTAYVMPNLVTPITSTDAAVAYREELRRISPQTEWLMTLYLHPDITVEEIHKAADAGVSGESNPALILLCNEGLELMAGVKSYPRGVTTNSAAGIEDYGAYYHVFSAMEDRNMVLNLHGEVPSDPHNVTPSSITSLAANKQNISVLNAEKHFLTHLRKLAADFPRLRIVLEHATTSEAVECVKSLPDNVACTITAHHLSLGIDDVVGQPYHFCKPVAKEPKDRLALQEAIKSGNPKFFLGSDSAPHPSSSKSSSLSADSPPTPCAAGVYTSPILVPLVATLLESFGALDKLEGYVSGHGRKFYGVAADPKRTLKLRKATGEKKVEGKIEGMEGLTVVPFWAGKKLEWEIVKE